MICCLRTSLAVQWLRLHTFTAGGMTWTPGEGTKMLHTAKRFDAFIHI